MNRLSQNRQPKFKSVELSRESQFNFRPKISKKSMELVQQNPNREKTKCQQLTDHVKILRAK